MNVLCALGQPAVLAHPARHLLRHGLRWRLPAERWWCLWMMAVLLLAGVAWPAAAFELQGSHALFALTADGQRTRLGAVHFAAPTLQGEVAFKVALEAPPLEDHFLSMREFKCLPGAGELSCHVPYPYPQPGTVRPGQWAWLEHSLLFFYKRPADFGAKLWNGVYFEFQETPTGLVGRPQAIDLNLIGAPPAQPALPPYRRALRDEIPPEARWIRALLIE